MVVGTLSPSISGSTLTRVSKLSNSSVKRQSCGQMPCLAMLRANFEMKSLMAISLFSSVVVIPSCCSFINCASSLLH